MISETENGHNLITAESHEYLSAKIESGTASSRSHKPVDVTTVTLASFQ